VPSRFAHLRERLIVGQLELRGQRADGYKRTAIDASMAGIPEGRTATRSGEAT